MPAILRSRQTWPRLIAGLVALLVAFGGEARACAVCLSGITITPGQKLDSADYAVLALPQADQGHFRVIEVIKGDVAADTTIAQPGLSARTTEPVMSLDGPIPHQGASQTFSGKPLLLVRDAVSEEWRSVGEIDAGYADWLRQLATTSHGKKSRPTRSWPPLASIGLDLMDVEWHERLAAVVPHLESGEPLVAEIAYGELARAPYSAIQALKPRLDSTKIATWINDPRLDSRLAGYTLLMGVAGGPVETDELEQRINSAQVTDNSSNLSAMLVADLELRGPSRVEWLEQRYFADRRRTLLEIEAALLALSVHGQANTTLSRARVIEAYRYFIRMRRPMAGFVATELADWGAWEVTADYVDIIRSKAVKDPAGEFAILSYLHESPETPAEAASQPSTNQPE